MMTIWVPDEAFRDLLLLYTEVARHTHPLDKYCRMDGACCRFAQSDLRLFLTPLESEFLVRGAGAPLKEISADACPYQVEGLCTARDSRPLGCRIYFCDPEADEEMSAVVEDFHGRLKALHIRHGIKYSYQELHRLLLG